MLKKRKFSGDPEADKGLYATFTQGGLVNNADCYLWIVALAENVVTVIFFG